MKAIIITKTGNYKNKFGHTFEVVELNQSFVSLKGANDEFPTSQVDFVHKEVIIVDIQQEYKLAIANRAYYQDCRLEGDWTRTKYEKKVDAIENNASKHGINLEK